MRERIASGSTRLEFIQRKLSQARRMLKFCKVDKNRAFYAAEVKRLETAEKHLKKFDAARLKGTRAYEIRSM